jgi:hypothetical protein
MGPPRPYPHMSFFLPNSISQTARGGAWLPVAGGSDREAPTPRAPTASSPPQPPATSHPPCREPLLAENLHGQWPWHGLLYLGRPCPPLQLAAPLPEMSWCAVFPWFPTAWRLRDGLSSSDLSLVGSSRRTIDNHLFLHDGK